MTMISKLNKRFYNSNYLSIFEPVLSIVAKYWWLDR